MLQEARQSSSVEAPAFRTTVERLRVFLLDLPEGFALDRTITGPLNALMNTFRALNSPESQPSGNMQNREAPEQPKAGKKTHQITRDWTKKDAAGSSLLVKASEQMTKFFEVDLPICPLLPFADPPG